METSKSPKLSHPLHIFRLNMSVRAPDLLYVKCAPVFMAWCVLRMRMKETASSMEGSFKYTEE